MGCSIALNRPAANLIRSRPRPKAAIMHDWWCYLVVSAFGRVIYDPSPSLLYRVHASNTVGLPTGVFELALAKVKRQIRSSSLSLIKAQAQEFREIYDDKLSREQIELIEALAAIDTLGGRFSFLSERVIYRQFFSRRRDSSSAGPCARVVVMTEFGDVRSLRKRELAPVSVLGSEP